MLRVDIKRLLIEGVFLGNLVGGSGGEIWRRSVGLRIVEVVGRGRVLLLVVL